MPPHAQLFLCKPRVLLAGEISVTELRTTMHELGDLLTEEEIMAFMQVWPLPGPCSVPGWPLPRAWLASVLCLVSGSCLASVQCLASILRCASSSLLKWLRSQPRIMRAGSLTSCLPHGTHAGFCCPADRMHDTACPAGHGCQQ